MYPINTLFVDGKAVDQRADGNAALARGDLDMALSCYSGALLVNPSEHYLALSNRSHVYMLSGLPGLALADAQACVRLQPGWGKGYLRLATALLALKRPDQAVTTLTAGLVALAAARPPALDAEAALTQQLAAAQTASAAAAAPADCHCFACSAVLPSARALHCSKCLRATYCNVACQAAAWRTTHKHACKLLRALPPRPRTPLKAWPPLQVRAVTWEEGEAAMQQLRSKHGIARPPHSATVSANDQGMQFSEAVGQGKSLEALERLVASYPTLDILFSLSAAVLSNRLDVVQMLLRCGAPVNIPATVPSTLRGVSEESIVMPVHLACINGRPAILRVLLEAGGDPNMRFEPLHLPRAKRDFTLPLVTCAVMGSEGGLEGARLQCAELLLQAGADLEAMDHEGRTSLRYLCVVGDKALPFIRLLLRAGACPDAASHLPYIGPCLEACIRKETLHLGVMRALLDHGASVAVWPMCTRLLGAGSSTIDKFTSPLSFLCQPPPSGSAAVQAARVAAARLLLGAGMCASTAVLLEGMARNTTPLIEACFSGKSLDMARLLLAHGAHPDAPPVNRVPTIRVSPLHHTLDHVVGSGVGSTVGALLAAGALPSSPVADLLCLAIAKCTPDVVLQLLQAGADVHSSGYGVMFVAPAGTRPQSLQPLADGRLHPHPTLTPLQCALRRGSTAVLQHLLDAGACSSDGASTARVPNMAQLLVSSDALEAGSVALLLEHPGTRSAALEQLASVSDSAQRRTLLHVAARKGHGAGVLELLAAGVSPTALDARGVLPLAELVGSARKARNRGEPRRGQYAQAVVALRAATGMTAGAVSPLSYEQDSEGELSTPELDMQRKSETLDLA